MGYKYRLICCVALLCLILLAVGIFLFIQLPKDNAYYLNKMMSSDELGLLTVGEIFAFDFDRAYIIDDCYISGEGFAKRYNLNISIEQVNSGISENIQRIVFVDKDGAFLYEFQCDINELIVSKNEMIIYPHTSADVFRKTGDGLRDRGTVLLSPTKKKAD